MENNNNKSILDQLEHITTMYKRGMIRTADINILKNHKISRGSIIKHISGRSKGYIGIVTGVQNGVIYVRYLNYEHLGYIISDPYISITFDEMIKEFGIKVIKEKYQNK